MQAGISLLTMGNHTWKNPELKTFIEDSNIIRPINDGSNLGSGYKIMNYNGQKVLVINALGKAFMNEDYEPFIMVKVLDGNLDYDLRLMLNKKMIVLKKLKDLKVKSNLKISPLHTQKMPLY